MRRTLKIIAGLGILVLAAAMFLQTGFARWAFFELFAYVKGVDVVGPTIVRLHPTDSAYQRWFETARKEIPVFEGLVIDDVATVALRPWPQMGEGVNGLYLRFADYQMTDGRIIEIPAGGKTASQRNLYEQGVYFISGSGHTILQQEGKPQQRVEWGTGDLFSVPLNVRHQHFNTGNEPARMLMVTTFPLLMNVMANEDFIAENPFAFTDRYDGSPDYFEQAEKAGSHSVPNNFVEDVRNTQTQPFDYRGKGNERAGWLMAGNSMLSLHISEMPPKMYKKAHRHSGDAFILLLSGEGFSLTWEDVAFHKRRRVDWKAGTLFVPPTFWYHQHLNTGSAPARYLAIDSGRVPRDIGLQFVDQLEVDTEEVRSEWQQALEKTVRQQP